MAEAAETLFWTRDGEPVTDRERNGGWHNGLRIMRLPAGYYAEIVDVENQPFRLLKRRDSRNYYCELAFHGVPKADVPRPVSTKTADLDKALSFGREYGREAHRKLYHRESLVEPPMRNLVDEFLRWVANQTKPQYQKDRVRRHKAITVHHLLPLFGRRTLSSITTRDAQEFVQQRQRDGAKQSTIAVDLNSLRTWCKFAVEKGWRKDRLLAPIKQQKPDEYNNSWFDEDAYIMLRLVLRYEDPALYNLVLFCYFTGCRVTEASNLQFEDVIPFRPRGAAPTIRVRLRGKLKRRTIPVSPVVATIVDRMAKIHGRNTGPVFPAIKKQSEEFTRILRREGLYYDHDGNTRHLGSLRHTRATIELSRDAFTKDMLASWMGHTVAEQDRTYSKVLSLLNQTGAYTRKNAKAGVNVRKGLRGVDRQRAMVQARCLQRPHQR